MQKLEDTVIDCYHIQYLLAQGGMSEVYLADDQNGNGKVAIKLVHSSNREYYERFRREVRTMVTLQNEHILPILDYGECGSWYYMVMPYREYGTLLKERLEMRSLSTKEAEFILEQPCSARQFAHEQGIIRCGIKPANVLLRDEQYASLADLGLAKKVGNESNLTMTDILMGTPEYMAPELADESASVASD